MPLILERIRRGERVDHYDTLRRRKDGSLVEISLTVSPIRDERGLIIGASKIARDISERRRLEQARELHLGELRHRVNNLLAMVSAIVHQTKVEHITAEAYRASLMGRITALAAAHEAAFQTDAGADLASLIGRLLEPYVDDPCREMVTIETSPPVSVPRGKVQALAFVLHELATNAVKYGALSGDAGQVECDWFERAPGSYSLRWKGLGGPRVESPRSSGFGARMIGAALNGVPGGGAILKFEPTGVQCELAFNSQ